MKTTTLRTHVAVLALAVLALSTAGRAQYYRLSGAPAGDPVPVPMTADHWETKENAEFLRQLGFYRGLMRLNSGNAVLKGTTFSDGTIEFDVNTIGRGSPGIAFRQQDNDNFELLYLRPDPACPGFSSLHAVRAPDAWRPALGSLSAISNTGTAPRKRVESHQDDCVRSADERVRERCLDANTAGRQP